MKKLPYVLIDLPASIVTNRQMLMGILRYVQLHGPWFTQIVGYDGYLSSGNALNRRPYDGAIVDFEYTAANRDIGQLGMPVVAMMPDAVDRNRYIVKGPKTELYSDNLGIGRAAADFLLARGFRNFAFIGISEPWSRNRLKGFEGFLRQHRQSCLAYELPNVRRGRRQLVRLQKWLTELPRPTALFVVNDPLARQVNNVALQAGIALPEDLSILGVDNDPVFCESTTPPISSVRMNTEECGFNAARALDQMMSGHYRQKPIVYGFSGVEERLSTLVSSHKDPLVAAISRTLADRIVRGTDPTVTIPALAESTRASVRLMEVRFKAETGRTLHEEITRLRFERAQTLLKTNAASIAEVARLCGFATASHFSVMFKRTFGLTPHQYRHR